MLTLVKAFLLCGAIRNFINSTASFLTTMKILMYGWEFPPLLSGGLGVACHAIVQELARKHHDVTVVLPHAIENFLDKKRVSIIGCDAITSGVKDVPGLQHQSWQEFQGIQSFSTLLSPYLHLAGMEYRVKINKAALAIAAIIEQLRLFTAIASIDELSVLRSTAVAFTGQYGINLLAEVCHYAIVAGTLASVVPHDIIHAHDWLTILAGIEAKKRSGKPLIFHVHALEPDRSGDLVDTRIFAIEKYGMEQADKIVAVSEYTKNIIVDKYGISADKIVTIHNGTYGKDIVDKESGKAWKGHKMVLFLGRLAQQKGPMYFIEAARKILAQRQDVHFVLVGSGGLWDELIRRVAELRLGKYIHFTGFLEHEKINHIFRLADVYVMPSVSEPFGISCLEALSYGVPVIISKQSGVAEVLPHVLKVDFWDVDEMSNKIMALLDYVTLQRVILQCTDGKLKELTWEKTATALVDLYMQLV